MVSHPSELVISMVDLHLLVRISTAYMSLVQIKRKKGRGVRSDFVAPGSFDLHCW